MHNNHKPTRFSKPCRCFFVIASGMQRNAAIFVRVLKRYITSILVIQLVAILGAILTSKASSKFGNIKTLIFVNFVWMALCFYAYFMETPTQFYIAAACVGLVMGGIQALARSTYSKFLPETEDTTSFFSFYDVAEKIGIVIGMVIFALIDQFTGSMRNAILFLFIFFLVGIVLLFRVPKENTVIE